jgi:poly(beta-D-mannuronate) C5 epimerase
VIGSTSRSAGRRLAAFLAASVLVVLTGLVTVPPARAAGPECTGAPARGMRYDASAEVLYLDGCGARFTPADVLAQYPDGSKIAQAGPGVWLQKVNVMVTEGAALEVAGASGTAELRLQSDGGSFVWLKTENGELSFSGTKVTSWDTSKGAPDQEYATGRAFIAARSLWTRGRTTRPPTSCTEQGGSREYYEARMDVVNSDIGYLGYLAGESYGLSWKVYSKTPPPGRGLYEQVDVFGDMTGSRIHHNYYGAYTFGSYCQRFTRNVFAENVNYGLDPHDDSDHLTASANTFQDNGNHGFICSVNCDHLVVEGNTSVRNRHGVMIHRNVNGAVIKDNVVTDNREAGIAVFDSHDAQITGNTVVNNAQAQARLSVGASRNVWSANRLAAASGPVIYMFKGTDAPTTGDGVPADNVFQNNTFEGNTGPMLKISAGRHTTFVNNRCVGSSSSGCIENGTIP